MLAPPPPHSDEAEEAVLGACLVSDEAADRALRIVQPGDLYSPRLRALLEVIAVRRREGEPCSPGLVLEHLRRNGLETAIGNGTGAAVVLSDLVVVACAAGNVEHYTQVICGHARRRDLQRLEALGRAAGDDRSDPEALAAEAASLLAASRARVAPPPPPRVAEDLEALDSLRASLRGREWLGLRTGTLPELDRRTLGLRGLVLLAAMPGVGKTTLAMQLVLDALRANPDAVAVVLSLEMPRATLYARALAALARVTWRVVVAGSRRDGQEPAYSPEEEDRLVAGRAELEELGRRLIVLDGERATGADWRRAIREALRSLHAVHPGSPRSMVLIDYLQMLPAPAATIAAGATDIEQDRARVAELVALRDELAGDPVLVISESRKPGRTEAWGGGMADVMGSARLSYSPDCVALLRPIAPRELAEHVLATRSQRLTEAQAEELRDSLGESGAALTVLDLVKGRDGFSRGRIALTHHYLESRLTDGWELPEALGVGDADLEGRALNAIRAAAERGLVGLSRGELCDELGVNRRREGVFLVDRLRRSGAVVEGCRAAGVTGRSRVAVLAPRPERPAEPEDEARELFPEIDAEDASSLI